MYKQLIFPLFIFFFLSPSSALAEQINTFNSDAIIKPDGTIEVVETVTYDFGSEERHGIFRKIDQVKENQEGKKFVLDIDVIAVTDENNAAVPFNETLEGEYLKIKIGDPNKIISGIHIYKIGYVVTGALTYFSDHDELYWNTTGNEWEVPITTIVSTITLPTDVQRDQVQTACFTGYSGSTESECLQSVNGNVVTITNTRPLSTSEGLTFTVGFPKGLVAVREPAEYKTFFETLLGKIVLLLFLILASLWFLVYPIWIMVKWWMTGRDPQVGGPVTAWYDPPTTPDGRKLLPGEAGTLIDEVVHLKDVSATIVDMARRGYLKIEEQKKNDFYLTKTTLSEKDALTNYEQELYKDIFKGADSVRIKDATLVSTVKNVEKKIYKRTVDDGFFDKDPSRTRLFYTVIGSIALFTFNIPLGFIAFVIGRHMPKKTLHGAREAMVAKSLKNFLTGQERQLTFQAKNQMWFERLLPYAVAFGVEKHWAEQFKDIALASPSWYSTYNNRPFNSVYFTNSLNSSFNSIAQAATPTSSSSGFSSGFSGGSSGGGGGGGGGGSW